MATVLLKHRSDLDPIYWKFVIDRSWREAVVRQRLISGKCKTPTAFLLELPL
jgi:hypothetical protein